MCSVPREWFDASEFLPSESLMLTLVEQGRNSAAGQDHVGPLRISTRDRICRRLAHDHNRQNSTHGFTQTRGGSGSGRAQIVKEGTSVVCSTNELCRSDCGSEPVMCMVIQRQGFCFFFLVTFSSFCFYLCPVCFSHADVHVHEHYTLYTPLCGAHTHKKNDSHDIDR